MSVTGQLPPVTLSREAFAKFWTERGFTIEEGIALTQGSHALVDEQHCFRGTNGNPNDFCDPFREDCSNIKMFQFGTFSVVCMLELLYF